MILIKKIYIHVSLAPALKGGIEAALNYIFVINIFLSKLSVP